MAAAGSKNYTNKDLHVTISDKSICELRHMCPEGWSDSGVNVAVAAAAAAVVDAAVAAAVWLLAAAMAAAAGCGCSCWL